MNTLKQILLTIWNSIWMSTSYTLMVFIFAAFIALCGWIAYQLFIGTLDYPIIFYPIDAIVAMGIIYLITRKRFKQGLLELWKQILKSY